MFISVHPGAKNNLVLMPPGVGVEGGAFDRRQVNQAFDISLAIIAAPRAAVIWGSCGTIIP